MPGSRNKQCELCKSVPRDENAAVWVHTFNQYEAAHGIAHPVRQRSTAEQTQFSTTGTALRKRVPGTGDKQYKFTPKTHAAPPTAAALRQKQVEWQVKVDALRARASASASASASARLRAGIPTSESEDL